MANERNLRPCEHKFTQEEAKKGGTNTEKLFVQERFYNEYLQKMGRLF